MDDALPTVGPLTPEWVDFFIMAGVFALVAIGALIWAYFFRKRGRNRRHKRRRQHNEHHRLNPTLAQIGGLPPPRQDEKFSERQPPTPTSPL
jgi:hypothetical protein